MTEVESLDLNSELSWNAARKLSSMLFPIPKAIGEAIKFLWEDQLASKDGVAPIVGASTLEALRMVERSAKLKVPLYFAASTLYPDKLTATNEDDGTKALVNILSPGLFAVLLALVYLHRRLNKICSGPHWETLSKELVVNMELGFLIGSAVPELGTANGTWAGGIRYIALAPFLIGTPDYFMRYRNLKKRRFDVPHERTLWHCDHAQIAAFVVSEFGFSSDLSNCARALRKEEDDEKEVMPAQLNTWRAAVRMIDSIKQNGDLSNLASEFDLTPEALENLKGSINALFKGKTSFDWMFKSGKPSEEESGSTDSGDS